MAYKCLIEWASGKSQVFESEGTKEEFITSYFGCLRIPPDVEVTDLPVQLNLFDTIPLEELKLASKEIDEEVVDEEVVDKEVVDEEVVDEDENEENDDGQGN